MDYHQLRKIGTTCLRASYRVMMPKLARVIQVGIAGVAHLCPRLLLGDPDIVGAGPLFCVNLALGEAYTAGALLLPTNPRTDLPDLELGTAGAGHLTFEADALGAGHPIPTAQPWCQKVSMNRKLLPQVHQGA